MSSPNEEPKLKFKSRRSPVLCRNGCVSSSQPLASSIGLQVLRDLGGNAADAAVATAAALAVLEPCSTGVGGDMFCLYYKRNEEGDGDGGTVDCINGSGRCPRMLTLEDARRSVTNGEETSDEGRVQDAFRFHVNAITVPGVVRGWEDLLNKHGSGRLSFAELLEPAARLAEEGFPVAPMTAHYWAADFQRISRWSSDGEDIPLSVDGKRAPRAGEIFKNPDLARVLRSIGAHGASKGFYEGEAGLAIVEAVRLQGGVMNLDDLRDHRSTYPSPIYSDYRGVRLWEAPPNGQGVAGLIALKGLQALEEDPSLLPFPTLNRDAVETHSADVYHAMIEMIRLGFKDAKDYVCDRDYHDDGAPRKVEDNVAAPAVGSDEWFLDDDRIQQRARTLFDPNKATVQGTPDPTSCTVSFQVVDTDGNAVSVVNSNFIGFGTGLVPKGCGFPLQNRGSGFSLVKGHPNCLAPGKRPLHTILPGMLTYADNGDLYATFTNMGGQMQPQGHLQLVVGMVAAGFDPQEAIDMPRFCILDGTREGIVYFEDGINDEVIKKLKEMGHKMVHGVSAFDRSIFGKAQIIKRDRKNGVLWAGSDGRGDGCAIGY